MVSYSNYLKTEELLNLQHPITKQQGQEAHEELLFITVHQTYELWFKQMLHEIDSVLKLFGQKTVDERAMGVIVGRLQRVLKIQTVLIDQVTILESMTPHDFLDFRDQLYPASGFQSVQFREIENKLGLLRAQRLTYNNRPYTDYVTPPEAAKMQASENGGSLFECVQSWLERTPFLTDKEFTFWQAYKVAVERMLSGDRARIENATHMTPDEKARNLQEVEKQSAKFAKLFDAKAFEELQKNGEFRLSFQAMHAALLISVYRDQPMFHLPFQLITALQDMDENLTMWRYRHMLMAHRMLGRKIGTGGSSGADYLQSTVDKHRVFNDFFNIATFLIPRSQIPPLPPEVARKLGFFQS